MYVYVCLFACLLEENCLKLNMILKLSLIKLTVCNWSSRKTLLTGLYSNTETEAHVLVHMCGRNSIIAYRCAHVRVPVLLYARARVGEIQIETPHRPTVGP